MSEEPKHLHQWGDFEIVEMEFTASTITIDENIPPPTYAESCAPELWQWLEKEYQG